MLEISPPQLITNIIGFLLLFWGLKRFAWGPLLGLLDERRARIQKEIETVADAKRQAEALGAEFESKMREIDALSRKRLEEASREALKVAAEIRDKAREEAAATLEKAKADIERERDKARVALRDDMVRMVIAAGEKFLHERLSSGKHEELIARYIDDLESIKP
jgi:F-type H+-transporting ATPase subunit b